jgi:hypothetical protein
MKNFLSTIFFALLATASFATTTIGDDEPKKAAATTKQTNTHNAPMSAAMEAALNSVITVSLTETTMEDGSHIILQTAGNQEVIVTDTFAKHQFSDNQTLDTIKPVMAKESIVLDTEEEL